jgi:hypothetical protein
MRCQASALLTTEGLTRCRTPWAAWAASAALAALAGCAANYTPRVDINELPTMEDAYLYGRFHIDAPKVALSTEGYQSMGFAFSCDSSSAPYIVRFDRDRPVVAIKIKPGVCSWTEIVYSDADGVVKQRKPAPPEAFKNLRFDGGFSYYVGDFQAEVKTTYMSPGFRTEWRIKAVRENFEITTDDMLEAFPKLRALPTENRMITRKEPPKAIPKPKGVGAGVA